MSDELKERKSCPCLHTTPCHSRCACVHRVSSSGCSRCCSYGLSEQQKRMAEILAAKIDSDSQWIDVRERLPEKDGESEVSVCVLGCSSVGSAIFVGYYAFRYIQWVEFTHEIPVKTKVTHWQPLPLPPNPPKEGKA